MILMTICLMLSPPNGKFNHNNSNAQGNTPRTTQKPKMKINNDEPPTLFTNDSKVRKNDVVFQSKLHIGEHLYQLDQINRNAQVNRPCTTLKLMNINNDEPPTVSNNGIKVRKKDGVLQPQLHIRAHLYQQRQAQFSEFAEYTTPDSNDQVTMQYGSFRIARNITNAVPRKTNRPRRAINSSYQGEDTEEVAKAINAKQRTAQNVEPPDCHESTAFNEWEYHLERTIPKRHRGDDTVEVVVQKHVLAVLVEPPDKQTLTNIQQPGRMPYPTSMLLLTATIISKQIEVLKQSNGKQRMSKIMPKVQTRCFIVSSDHRSHFSGRRIGIKSVPNQHQFASAQYPRDSLRQDSHHGHRSSVRSNSRSFEKFGSYDMRKSGRLFINGNVSKCKLQCDRSTGKYVFRNGYPFTRNSLQAKSRAVTYKQELRTYVHDRRYSNKCRGIRPPCWPAVLYPDNPLDSFVDISLSTWLVHKLGHKFTRMYLPTFALRTTSAFPGLALCTTMAYCYLRTYLSTWPLDVLHWRTVHTIHYVTGCYCIAPAQIIHYHTGKLSFLVTHCTQIDPVRSSHGIQ